MTGLCMNLSKSSLLLGSIQGGEAQLIANLLGVRMEVTPIKYLGLPMYYSRVRICDCLPLMERTLSIVQSW